MILLIDNYDSFVHNLARYFRRLGQETRVIRNDQIDVASIRGLAPDAIIISPGPCTPNEAGISLDLVRELASSFPMLGVCLGHQVIAAALGAKIVRAAQPMHGRTSMIQHDETCEFSGVDNPLTVARYHSLVVDPASLPDTLTATAFSKDGALMALRHRSLPLIGFQFHPESVLTQAGFPLLRGFLRIAGLCPSGENLDLADELIIPPARTVDLPNTPVTF